MPARRSAAKSIYTTIASSMGSRLSIAAGVSARERYQIIPETERPHTAQTRIISSHARSLGVTIRVSHSRRSHGARFGPQPDIGFELGHHAAEIGQRQRLRAVAHRLLRARVYFDDQAVGAD